MTNTFYHDQSYSWKTPDECDPSLAKSLYSILLREVQSLVRVLGQDKTSRNDTLRRCVDRLRGWSKAKIGLVVIWVLMLWWGERITFGSSVSSCEWEKWEHWVPIWLKFLDPEER